jgi:hypothetical protein
MLYLKHFAPSRLRVTNSSHCIFKKAMLGLMIVMLYVTVGETQAATPDTPESTSITTQWSGRAKITGVWSDHDDQTVLGSVQDSPFYDSRASVRLNNETFFSPRFYSMVHLETGISKGDTIEAESRIQASDSDTPGGASLFNEIDIDDRRLFDLTKTVSEGDDYEWLVRLDRLNITYEPDWGQVRIGRQAVTWGNGFLFNPMDLFNPFAPTEIDRDYKVGDDMAAAIVNLPTGPELQVLLVPRRDPVTGDLEWDQSSLATKLHWATTIGATEFDLLGAIHYDNVVLGIGSRGYIGDAAWRMDGTWTFLSIDDDASGYLAWVANLDYSWVWGGKNFYGLLEAHYNGLGEDDPGQALLKPAFTERLLRGEVFTLGRWYLAGTVQMEVHPLVQVFLTTIAGLENPSLLLQPYLNWDITQNLQLTLGAILPVGGPGTEFGGFQIPGTDLQQAPPTRVFGWLTWYF